MTSTGTTLPSKRFSPRVIRIRVNRRQCAWHGNRNTAAERAARVHVDEVRVRIVAYSAANQSESGLARLDRVDAGHPADQQTMSISPPGLNGKAILSGSSGAAVKMRIKNWPAMTGPVIAQEKSSLARASGKISAPNAEDAICRGPRN